MPSRRRNSDDTPHHAIAFKMAWEKACSLFPDIIDTIEAADFAITNEIALLYQNSSPSNREMPSPASIIANLSFCRYEATKCSPAWRIWPKAPWPTYVDWYMAMIDDGGRSWMAKAIFSPYILLHHSHNHRETTPWLKLSTAQKWRPISYCRGAIG